MAAPVQLIYTDNPKADVDILKEIFGPEIKVKKDIWHVLDKYYKACYAHSLRTWFMGDLSDCFFTADADDMARVAAEIRDKYPEHT